MKGNPALRTVLVLLFLAAVSYPVWRVISSSEARASQAPSAKTSPSQPQLLKGILHIRTAPAPLRLRVMAGEKVVLATGESDPSGELIREISLPPGSDLLLHADWGDDRPHALHAEFVPSGANAPVGRDYWGNRSLEDVLSLP
jgi:hypothetical protein